MSDSTTDSGSCGTEEAFALRVIGDDMKPEFDDGHIIIVDPGGKVTSGCYVVVNLDDELIFRQLIIDNGRYRLHALASELPDIDMPNGPDDIVGVISQRSGKRRSDHKRYDVYPERRHSE